jgi:hypothetical protein
MEIGGWGGRMINPVLKWVLEMAPPHPPLLRIQFFDFIPMVLKKKKTKNSL